MEYRTKIKWIQRQGSIVIYGKDCIISVLADRDLLTYKIEIDWNIGQYSTKIEYKTEIDWNIGQFWTQIKCIVNQGFILILTGISDKTEI